MLLLKVISSLIVTLTCFVLILEYPSNIVTVSISLFSSSILSLVISWNVFNFLNWIYVKCLTPKIPSHGKIVLITGNLTNSINEALFSLIDFLRFQYFSAFHQKLFSGCDSGFGHLTALKLNELGFIVYATCLSLGGEGAKALIADCVHPQNMTVVQLNVTDRNEIDQVFELINCRIRNHIWNNNENEPKVISLYALINNAGISRTGELEWGDFDTHFVDTISVNTLGALYMIRKSLPLLRACPGGARVINVTSIAGKLTASGTIAYSMSKAALISLSAGLRREMEKFKIKVIEVEPMFYKTPLIHVEQVKQCLDQLWSQTPTDIRAEYGQDYFDAMKSKCISVLEGGVIINKHPEQVVDAIQDALTSVSPLITYRCANCFNRLTFWIILTLLPPELVDLIMKYSHIITDKHFLKKLVVKS